MDKKLSKSCLTSVGAVFGGQRAASYRGDGRGISMDIGSPENCQLESHFIYNIYSICEVRTCK